MFPTIRLHKIDPFVWLRSYATRPGAWVMARLGIPANNTSTSSPMLTSSMNFLLLSSLHGPPDITAACHRFEILSDKIDVEKH
ncbi:hypothetical protein PoB_006449600 [Plakobranchus ocellatus]|uniref:Uncharacterized protein n=1 Tax=Plakobranchus ocellatus TaxID=259542 RepID=A0AAV4D1B1_9GAST|nr:hypothetical protein PoB_006449600 [Plakobranchus ocellatus]